MVKTIAEAIQEFQKRVPNGVPVVVIPAGDTLAVDVNTVAVWTDRVTVPMVLELNPALAIVFGGIAIKQGPSGGVQVAPMEDDDDE